jgi:cysteine synthase B
MTAPILDPRLKALEELRWHVGNTPMHTMVRLSPKPGVEIHAKLEWQQFGGSLQARPAFDIIHDALVSGALRGRRLLDATTGNTGIAYAIFAAAAGIPVTLCIPEDVTKETKHMLNALGVDLHFTDASEGFTGARKKAEKLAKANSNTFYFVDHLRNEATVKAHYRGTGMEVWLETAGRITHFIAGLDTSNAFEGVGKRLVEFNPDIKLVELQPYHTSEISSMIDRAAKEEGLFLSPSSAAHLLGALKLAEEIEEGVIATILPDDATKY